MKRISIAIILLLIMCSAAAALPPSYDCRDKGYVTPVKDMGGCECCNAFVTVAMLESAILANGGAEYDLSEEHAKNCPFEAVTGTAGGCSGGNANMVINIFTQRGALLESDDPYVSRYAGKCNYIDDPVIRVTDWHLLSEEKVPNMNVIKNAIMKYGPVFTTIDEGCLPRKYDGKSVIRGQRDVWEGHALLIVGWDDFRRCWIVKNSWGTGWGDDGYGYVSYAAGKIGAFSSVIAGHEMYDPNVRTLYHDEAGWTTSKGYLYQLADGWEMCVFPIKREMVESIEFWTTGPTDDVDLYIYNRYSYSYNNGGFGTRLYKIENLKFANAGYHSIDLRRPVSSKTGQIVVVAHFKNAKGSANQYTPLAIDAVGVATKDAITCKNRYQWSWWNKGGDATLRLRVRDGDNRCIQTVVRAEGGTTIQKGETLDFSVMCYKSGGSGTYCGPIEWRCSDQSVGTIDYDGVFTAKNDGKTYIAARCNGCKSRSVLVTVSSKDRCDGVVCNNYCEGTTLYTDGYCVDGRCRYTQQPKSLKCGYDQCTNVVCKDHCKGTTWCYNGICIGGVCKYTETINAAKCGYDLCSGVVCKDHCRGTIWYHDGYCLNGGCVYFIDKNSPKCSDDPCYGMVCKDHCRGTTWFHDGYCLNGGCVYFTDRNSPKCDNT